MSARQQTIDALVKKGYDRDQVAAAFRGSKFGEQDQKRYDVAMGTRKTGKQVKDMRKEQGLRDSYNEIRDHKKEGGTLGGNAQKQYDRMGHRINRIDDRQEAKARAQAHTEKSVRPVPPAADPPKPPGTTNQIVKPVQDNDMEQTVTQDNDIETSITGDNNYVNNQQDNSIRQYGGDNRQFTYVGGKDSRLDTPASMATLGGIWGVDDSPAAQAKFTDLYSTLNRDSQKRYSDTSSIAMGAIKRADQNEFINTNAVDKRIYDREMYSRAKSDMMGMNLFGDMYNMEIPDWQSPERQTEVEKPDFESMYDKYTDF